MFESAFQDVLVCLLTVFEYFFNRFVIFLDGDWGYISFGMSMVAFFVMGVLIKNILVLPSRISIRNLSSNERID